MTHGLYHRSKNRVWWKDTHFRSVLSFLLSKKREVSFPLWLKMTDIQRALDFHFPLSPWPDILLGCATLPGKHWHAHTPRLRIMRHQMRTVISSPLTGWMQMRSHRKRKKTILAYHLVCQICGFVDSLYSGNKWFDLDEIKTGATTKSVFLDECRSSDLKSMKNCDQISFLQLNLPLKDTSVSQP